MSDINAEIISERQAKLIQALKGSGLDGIVLNPGPSLTYMTGLHFHLSERPVVFFFKPDQKPALALPKLESAKTQDLPYEISVHTYGEEPTEWAASFKSAASDAGLDGAKVGVEDRVLRLLELRLLQMALPESEFLNAVDTMAQLRMYKDAGEIAAMQKAVDIAEAALEAALPQIKLGMTEQDLAAELTMHIFRGGSGSMPFSPIVATGPNSANPHAAPTNRKLTSGELLVIDWGASVEGIYSDITRTFGVGEVSDEQANIHQIVQDANAAARAVSKPGTACGDVDKAARDVIENAGYGEWFIHRTGHGLGLEVHEEPYIRAGNSMALEPGMTFTIEPGIYHPEIGGARIEDDVVVTNHGLKSLTSLKRELNIVG